MNLLNAEIWLTAEYPLTTAGSGIIQCPPIETGTPLFTAHTSCEGNKETAAAMQTVRRLETCRLVDDLGETVILVTEWPLDYNRSTAHTSALSAWIDKA